MSALSGDGNSIINHYQYQLLMSEYSDRLDFSLKRSILPVVTDQTVPINDLLLFEDKNKAAK